MGDRRNQNHNNRYPPRNSQSRSFPSRAPYNFVPFDYMPFSRYNAVGELPPHDTVKPELLSGEIQLTLTAQTPIFVGAEDGGFARAADGIYQIPGSTLRGLIRENMQILGCGLVRAGEDFDDRRLLYRSLADPAGGLKYKRKQYYIKVLGIQTRPAEDKAGKLVLNPKNGKQKQYSVAWNVWGGYLHNENDRFYIVPVKGRVYSISRKSPLADRWKNRYTFTEEVSYRASGDAVTDIRAGQVPGYQRGTLLSPGWMSNQGRVYLFPEEDPDSQIVELTDEERLSYQEDLEARQNGLSGTKKNMDPGYWTLPKNGQRKPVFFTHYEDRTMFGMSQFLRLSYAHRFSEGLPEGHRKQQKTLFLDYPYAVMGFSEGDNHYRSRVSVGDMKAVRVPGEPERIKMVLGEPKPSFFPNYTKNGLDYNQAEFQLNGYKQYWLKAPAAVASNHDNLNKTVYPLPAGMVFSGSIRYRNLYPDELGLLLWCLRLEEGCFQTIGMGKPYGFGRVQVRIDAMKEYGPESLYRSLTAAPAKVENTQQRVAQLIRGYQIFAAGGQEPGIQNLSHIQDFLFMKRWIFRKTDEVRYLDLNKPIVRADGSRGTEDEHRKVTESLKPVRVYRQDCGQNGGHPK